MSKCRGCGAELVWGRTSNGKTIPLDAKPEKRAVVVSGDHDPRAPGALTFILDTYVPHFATCPNASDFRRTMASEEPVEECAPF